MDGPGTWLAGHDRSGLLQRHFLVNAGDHDTFRLNVDLDDLTGETPADVLPAMRLLADFVPENTPVLTARSTLLAGSPRRPSRRRTPAPADPHPGGATGDPGPQLSAHRHPRTGPHLK
ncbi:hypothetical protein FXF51_31655 [Nonomuraea sp. PA05]|uniref:hypothetical protein n=1 Tax=Nonomuraea sp. PA05 TaxID=2604466 RepID=UPI0011D5641F|nr:hypothetical protein [Nonomuraea sp. PA05]TYB60164.1 hypothetical protein FXF51_31655 [Nonomuraea sp. PA05]